MKTLKLFTILVNLCLFVISNNAHNGFLETQNMTSAPTITTPTMTAAPSPITTATLSTPVTPQTNSFNPTNTENAEIFVTADDHLDSIKVNNVAIPLDTVANLANKDIVKIIRTNLSIGDELSITASNLGTVTAINPAMILATIYFINKAGYKVHLNTSNRWVCNNQPAKILSANKDKKIWKEYTEIDKNADFIWSISSEIITTCNLIIYQPAVRSDLKIMVDNTLVAVRINGHNLTLPTNLENYNVIKYMTPFLTTGDTLEIEGLNSVAAQSSTTNTPASPTSPGAIMATLKFINKYGEWQEVSTDKSWSCNGAAATELGSNSQTTIWSQTRKSFYVGISPNAQFIWSSSNTNRTTCKILLETAKRSGSIIVSVENYLVSIVVNTTQITINRSYSQSYNVSRLFKTYLKSGDKVQITAKKGKLEPGIIATLSYYNNANKSVSISTGTNWTCNGAPAKIFPLDTEICPEVDQAAEWIWTSDGALEAMCEIILP